MRFNSMIFIIFMYWCFGVVDTFAMEGVNLCEKRSREEDDAEEHGSKKSKVELLFDKFKRMGESEVLVESETLFEQHGKIIFIVQDSEKNTYLHAAAQCGYLKVAKFLVQNFTDPMGTQQHYIDRSNVRNMTALHVAVQASQRDMVEFLLQNNPNLGSNFVQRTVFLEIDAAHADALEIITLLCAYYKRDGQVIPYHVIVAKVIEKSRQDILTELLKISEIQELIKDDSSFLHRALMSLDVPIFKLLLQAGAPYNELLISGKTPLEEAILLGSRSRLRYSELITDLLKLPNIDINTTLGTNLPLHTALIHNKLTAATLLLEKYPEIVNGNDAWPPMPLNKVVEEGKYEFVLLFMKNPKVAIDIYTNLATLTITEWHKNQKDVHLKILRLLIRYGAFVDEKDELLPIALVAAFARNPLCVAVIMKDRETVQQLMASDEYKEGLYNYDSDGATPLMYAAAQGNREFVELLLDTPLMAKANDGCNVLDILTMITGREVFECYELKHKITKEDLLSIKELIQDKINKLAEELVEIVQDEHASEADLGCKDVLKLIMGFTLGAQFAFAPKSS